MLKLSLFLILFTLTNSALAAPERLLSAKDLPILRGAELSDTLKVNGWKFKLREIQEPYATGRLKAPIEAAFRLPSKEFIKADALYPANFDLRDKTQLTAVKDQGQCGSCVYFATTAAFEDENILRGNKPPVLSPQWLMDCAMPDWSCDGSIFEKVAGGLVSKGGMAALSDYSYRAQDQACKAGNFPLYGKVAGYKIIDNSHQSIIGALNQLHPVPTTIGAGGYMMQYGGGAPMPASSCQNIATNHEMVIIGYGCGTSVDSNKNCKFDSKGMLAKGSGSFWIIRNSWNTSYGEKGFLYISMMNNSGSRCNNVTEEVGIVDSGMEPVPPTPPGPVGKEFSIDNDVATVKGTVKASYVQAYDMIVKVLNEFLNGFKD